MRELTEDFLLQRGGKHHLEDIRSLDLSDQGLEELDEELFEHMTKLESLDLSDNQLSEIPPSLSIRWLRRLDVSSNQLDSVEFVQQFPNLEELNIEDNELQPSDKYIVAAIIPLIRVVNGKSAESLRWEVNSQRERLLPEIKAAFEANFSDEEITHSNMWEIAAQLLAITDKLQKLKSPTNVQKFRDYMIQLLCVEVVTKGIEPLEPEPVSRTTSESGTPSESSSILSRPKKVASHKKGKENGYRRESLSKTKRGGAKSPLTSPGNKNKSKSTPVSSKKTPKGDSVPQRDRKSANGKMLIQMALEGRTIVESPVVKMKRRQQIQRRQHVGVGSPGDVSPKFTDVKKRKIELTKLPSVPDYDPEHFLRCHFCSREANKEGHTHNDPSDDVTTIWSVAFEPDISHPGETTHRLASCGGEDVCLIDCNTGKVLKRYREPNENFYCLAWTTLKIGKKNGNLLAVGCYNGKMRILIPEQGVCVNKWGMCRPNRRVVNYYMNCVLFHPTRPNILFGGASDSTVTVWDLGPIDSDYKMDVQRIQVLACPSSGIQQMVYSVETDYLIAGCVEFGIYAWKVPAEYNHRKRLDNYDCHMHLPKTQLMVDCFVDGMCVVAPDLVASKVVNLDKIFLWRPSEALANPRKTIHIEPLLTLDFKKTELDALNVGSIPGLLGCGDDDGDLWLYNLEQFLTEKHITVPKQLKPSRKLKWPDMDLGGKSKDKEMVDIVDKADTVEVAVNCIAFSSNQEFIAAGTDNNLLCIWRRIDK